jgi:hypothetical protein
VADECARVVPFVAMQPGQHSLPIATSNQADSKHKPSPMKSAWHTSATHQHVTLCGLGATGLAIDLLSVPATVPSPPLPLCDQKPHLILMARDITCFHPALVASSCHRTLCLVPATVSEAKILQTLEFAIARNY